QSASTFDTIGGAPTKVIGPSPTTWYAIDTSPLCAYFVSTPTSAIEGLSRAAGLQQVRVVVEASEQPATVVRPNQFGDGRVLDVAHERAEGHAAEDFERATDHAAVTHDDCGLALLVAGGHVEHGLLDAGHEHLDALRPRRPHDVACRPLVEHAIALVELVPTEPLALARML